MVVLLNSQIKINKKYMIRLSKEEITVPPPFLPSLIKFFQGNKTNKNYTSLENQPSSRGYSGIVTPQHTIEEIRKRAHLRAIRWRFLHENNEGRRRWKLLRIRKTYRDTLKEYTD